MTYFIGHKQYSLCKQFWRRVVPDGPTAYFIASKISYSYIFLELLPGIALILIGIFMFLSVRKRLLRALVCTIYGVYYHRGRIWHIPWTVDFPTLCRFLSINPCYHGCYGHIYDDFFEREALNEDSIQARSCKICSFPNKWSI